MKALVLSIVAAGLAAFAVNAKEKEGLDGLFGVKFGKVMDVNEECMTNNVGELAYEYIPTKMFRKYTDYVIFATPLTRQVSQVRAIAHVSYSDAEEEMRSTILALEMKFNRKAISLKSDKKTLIFDNGDAISVVRDGRRITIDATCDRLRDLTIEEVKKAEKIRYAEDIRVLALLPKKERDEDKIYRIDSVFGVKLGESLTTFSVEKNNAGAWVHEFTPDAQFMGCEDYRIFTTAKTKKVFMIRAVFSGPQYEARRDQIRRVIESVTGYKFRSQDDDSLSDEKNLRMRFGEYCIDLDKNSIADMITLDFVNVNLFLLNQKEHKEIEAKAARADMDAL